MTRREMVTRALFGGGLLGLRALASGIPATMLAHPELASAQAQSVAPGPSPQFLILSTSYLGDGLNANVPGTYEDLNIAHPPGPTMAPTSLMLGGQSYTAAAPWATLPPQVLARTCFFHHATNTSVHSEASEVLKLNGAIVGDDMLVATLSRYLAHALSTVQTQPLCLGAATAAESISYGGAPQPMLSPRLLSQVLTAPDSPLHALESLRDTTLNQMNVYFKTRGGRAQTNFVDQYATSQNQVRSLSQSLLGNLAQVTNNGAAAQVMAAIAMIQLRVAPVMTIHIPFGGDNHVDPNLANEAAQTAAGVGTVTALMQQLGSAGLADNVTFASLNVFGRTLALSHKGTQGRDHNRFHQCSLLVGKHVAAGVIGGVAPCDNDYGALPIDSRTGRGALDGDVTQGDSMAAFGMTLAAAVGLTPAIIAQSFHASSAKVVQAALSVAFT